MTFMGVSSTAIATGRSCKQPS